VTGAGASPRSATSTARSGGPKGKRLEPVPAFADETEERAFWQAHDTTDHVDWSKAERVRLPNLEPSATAISPRLPVSLLKRIKVAANRRDVPSSR
jgi:hypothetical protein